MGWIESTKWVNARNGKPGNTLRNDEGSTNDEKSLVRLRQQQQQQTSQKPLKGSLGSKIQEHCWV